MSFRHRGVSRHPGNEANRPPTSISQIRKVKAKFAITFGFNENFNKCLAKKHLEVCS